MYKLPKDFDVSFLIGRELESVCFAQYQVNLNFTDGVRVQIEGRFKLFGDADLLEQVDEFPISHSALPRIIGQKVTAANVTADSDLELVLNGENRLFVIENNGPYESFRIYDGQKETII
jgi:hypothetical protein